MQMQVRRRSGGSRVVFRWEWNRGKRYIGPSLILLTLARRPRTVRAFRALRFSRRTVIRLRRIWLRWLRQSVKTKDLVEFDVDVPINLTAEKDSPGALARRQAVPGLAIDRHGKILILRRSALARA